MAAWVKEEENASEHGQRKREAEEADKVKVAPGVTVESLRRFTPALIRPIPRTPQSASTVAMEKPETPRVYGVSCRCYAFGCKCEIVAIRGGYRMARGWRHTKNSLYRVPFYHFLA